MFVGDLQNEIGFGTNSFVFVKNQVAEENPGRVTGSLETALYNPKLLVTSWKPLLATSPALASVVPWYSLISALAKAASIFSSCGCPRIFRYFTSLGYTALRQLGRI